MSDLSVWEKHKHKLYIWGNIYATLNGLLVINYVPKKKSKKSFLRCITIIYAHAFSLLLIVLLPIYFVYNMRYLVETHDRKWQLQLLVNFSNTLIKYCIVVITYVANFVHYNILNSITKRRQLLEDKFNDFYNGSQVPRKKFEFMLFFKFGTINVMMAVQISQIIYQYYVGAHSVRVYFQVYTFFLWNYTENMADYFYFINCSTLKFLRQLQEQLKDILKDNHLYNRRRRERTLPHLGILIQLCCGLCDRLDFLAQGYIQLYNLYFDGVASHQFQLLGLMFTSLISNLTSLFTLYNMLMKHSNYGDKLTDIILNLLFAIIFYIDTYIVSMISDQIQAEIEKIQKTLKGFSELHRMDARLDERIENFSFLLKLYNGYFSICGLFHLDRHLTFLTAATGLNYFITLVQFDINLKK